MYQVAVLCCGDEVCEKKKYRLLLALMFDFVYELRRGSQELDLQSKFL